MIGTVIARNVISDEDVDVAINTPSEVDLHLNDLLGEKVGVADVCAFDKASACTGSIDATQNWWGCFNGPGHQGCSNVSGTDIMFVPWLSRAVTPEGDEYKRTSAKPPAEPSKQLTTWAGGRLSGRL